MAGAASDRASPATFGGLVAVAVGVAADAAGRGASFVASGVARRASIAAAGCGDVGSSADHDGTDPGQHHQQHAGGCCQQT